MSSSLPQLQAPLMLFRSEHDPKAKCAPGLPGSSKECSLPITLVGALSTAHPPACSQALPSICWKTCIFDDHHVSVVDHHHSHHSLPVIYECCSPDIDRHVVNHPVYDSFQSSTTVHAFRPEIAPSLINTDLSVRSPPAKSCADIFNYHNSTPVHTRSLTENFNVSNTMMTTIPSAPGSPPDLSGSRSSASSSYCSSSSPTSGEGIGTDITHYEDITLDDDRPANPAVRSSVAERRHSSSVDTKSTRPNLGHQIREAVTQHEKEVAKRKSGSFAPLRRGHTMQTLGAPSTINGDGRIRSVSPPKRLPRIQSTGAMSATLKPGWQPTRVSMPLPARRSSWQPKRKSVKELEAECNDSDDDLPDDASLWNVPVSPHVGPGSSRSSLVSSPNRSPVLSSTRPIPLSHARTAPDSPPRSRHSAMGKQRSYPHRSSSAHNLRSTPSSPSSSQLRRSDRARSWNFAMEELSEEARIISENLEYLALQERSNGNPQPRPLTRPQTIQLPPIQKGSLDFMPISKEKEAVLSRTRPSWLPPKDPREEQKHLREYQRMMAASLEAEKKRQSQMQVDCGQKESDREALARIWAFYSDDASSLTEMDPRVFPLCWRGVTGRLRGKVWRRSIGNQLGLTAKSFEKALERAKLIESTPKDQLGERERALHRWFRDIERDAETAFPELHMFQQKGPLWQDLVNVCKAYACYRSDIGYIYGLQLIAALLLLQLPTATDAFVVLANALQRNLPLAFLSGDISSTTRTLSQAVSTLAIKFPRLHEYLFGSMEVGGLGLSPEQVFEPMLRTLFTNGLDVERLCRVWDIWAFEGDKVLVHTGVALVGSLQTQLFEIEGDIDLRRRNIQEMLAWGPFNRTVPGEYWRLTHTSENNFVEDINWAGKLDYRGQ